MKYKKRNGFTLFELLVSISIIAILTALASVSFSSAQKKARDSRRMQDMNSIQKAAEMYYSLNSASYPITHNTGAKWEVGTQTVLENFPKDPKSSGSYLYDCTTQSADGYCCCAKMENTTAGNSTSPDCSFAPDTGYFCVKNQQ
jgi:prepilin-type N-terminal cleavage/methylation domain-containing protein